MPPRGVLPGTEMLTETFCDVVVPAAHEPMMQLAGQVSAGFGCTLGLFSSTVFPSSQVSVPSTWPLPHTGIVVVVVVVVTVVVEGVGWSCPTTAATHSLSTMSSTVAAAPAHSVALANATLNLSSAFWMQAGSIAVAFAVALALQPSFAPAFFPDAPSF